MSDSTEALLIGYILNTLPSGDRKTIESLLAENPEVAAQRQEMEAILGLMAYASPPVATPPRLRFRVMEAARRQTVPTLPKRVWSTVQWRDGAIAAMLLLVLGLSFDNFHLHRKVALQDTALAALQNAHTEVFSMKATPAALGASGRVLLDVQGGYAVIVMHKLPPLPKGEAYHLWAFTPQAKVLCGRFNPTQTDGQVNLSLAQTKRLQSVRFMRISREAIAPPQHKPKQRVLVLTSEL